MLLKAAVVIGRYDSAPELTVSLDFSTYSFAIAQFLAASAFKLARSNGWS
jgi:hypothetical protein